MSNPNPDYKYDRLTELGIPQSVPALIAIPLSAQVEILTAKVKELEAKIARITNTPRK